MPNTRSTRGRGGQGRGQTRSQGSVQQPVDDRPLEQPVNIREAIAEEVAKILQDVLPTLIGQQIEAVVKGIHDRPQVEKILEEQGETGDGMGKETLKGTASDSKGGCTYKAFLDCKPTMFSGTDDPIVAMTWLKQTEKIFRTSKCGEEDKVEYATNLLLDGAHFGGRY